MSAGVAVLAACALTLWAAPVADSQVGEPTGSAFGYVLDATVQGEEFLNEGPEPVIECPGSDEAADVEVPPEVGILTAGVVDLLCEIEGGVLTSTARATEVFFVAPEGGVRADVLVATCSADGDVEGSSEIVGLEVAGTEELQGPVPVTGEPNQVVPLGPLTLTLNRQTEVMNSDGTTTLTVDALVVEIDGAFEGLGEVVAELVLSSVSCTTAMAVDPPPTEPPLPPSTEPPTTEPPAPPTTEPPAPPPGGAVPVTGQPTFTG